MNFEDRVLALFDNGRRSAVYVAGYQSARAQAASIAAEADRLIAEMAVENAELKEQLAAKEAELREALRESEHFLTQIDPVHWPSKREARRTIGIVRAALASPAAEPEQKADVAGLVEALEKYESAFEELFVQCCSNPVTNAWGQPVSMAALNDAHAFASSRLATHRKQGGE